MSATAIFGEWDEASNEGSADDLRLLWGHLAAQNVGKPDFQPNSGLSQRKAEIISLWELYRRASPKVVLEIGVAQGGTFASWCFLGRPDALIIGVDRDVNDCRPRPGDQVSRHIVSRDVNLTTTQGGGMYSLGRNNQVIEPINGWSHSPHVIELLNLALKGRKIDWIFHDASHDEAGSRRDFDIYWPLLADGGVMAFHDIMPSAHPAVTKDKFWEWAKSNVDYSACMEFRGSRTDDSLGIGVLIK